MGSNFVTRTLSFLFGNKGDRDMRMLRPLVDSVNGLWPDYQSLSNDELRGVGDRLREQVRGALRPLHEEAESLRERLRVEDLSLSEREKMYTRISDLEASVGETVEAELKRVQVEAFTLIRETARRFAGEEDLVVTANDFDRHLAGSGKDFIRIEGDKAIYLRTWEAGGSPVSWDMVHYDVQLMGGGVLHDGKIAEMSTGEGKTLVATLPVFLNALSGLGVHVVTVNDYLARRDSQWMGPLYQFHGLSVDCIDLHQPSSEGRRRAYQADITFGTNNEFGFDYLRDNMAFDVAGLVQRQHNYAIVDEVDSVLIDDARTPLIISGPTNQDNEALFGEYLPDVEILVKAQQKLVGDQLLEAKRLLGGEKPDEESAGKLLLRAYKGLPKYKAFIKYESEPGVKNLRLKTENFYMQNNSKDMHLITDDLYFVLDEKNNSVTLTDKGTDLLSHRVKDPDFFVLPDIGGKLADLDARRDLDEDMRAREREEILRDYSLKAERLHVLQQLLRAYTMFERDVEYVVTDNQVKIVDEQTGRVLEGRRYSDGLHQAIEAKEGVKIEAPTQTFATVTLQNYFRMYRKLAGMTGTAETEADEFWKTYKLEVVVIPTHRPVIRMDEEDLVYRTAAEKFAAVIEKIQELVDEGRPVLVGTTSVEISEQLSRMLKFARIPHNVLNAKQHQREAEIVAQAGRPGTVTIATNMAGRGTDIKLTEVSRAAGGLAIIGTERHESRRVDRQLRGRSGRQGDPGSSIFFVSLEDSLMRLFGSDRMAKMMDRLGYQEGEVIQHPWITKAIGRAQEKVEQNNFGIRKRLLEYDDVMNMQREQIYSRRRHALFGERMQEDMQEIIAQVTDEMGEEYSQGASYSDFNDMVLRHFAMTNRLSEADFSNASASKLSQLLYEMVWSRYLERMRAISYRVLPPIRGIRESQGNRFENVVVPLSDGSRALEVVVNIDRVLESEGRELIRAISRGIILNEIDRHWQQHLLSMDELKQSVQAASYEQKDPLLIYKLEGHGLFQRMVRDLNYDVLQLMLRIHLPVREQSDRPMREASQERRSSGRARNLRAGRTEVGDERSSRDRAAREAGSGERVQEPIRREKRVGRNDPCPCGSGKKYKMCCGRPGAQASGGVS